MLIFSCLKLPEKRTQSGSSSKTGPNPQALVAGTPVVEATEDPVVEDVVVTAVASEIKISHRIFYTHTIDFICLFCGCNYYPKSLEEFLHILTGEGVCHGQCQC